MSKEPISDMVSEARSIAISYGATNGINPTLRNSGKGWGTHGVVSLKKKRERRATRRKDTPLMSFDDYLKNSFSPLNIFSAFCFKHLLESGTDRIAGMEVKCGKAFN